MHRVTSARPVIISTPSTKNAGSRRRSSMRCLPAPLRDGEITARDLPVPVILQATCGTDAGCVVHRIALMAAHADGRRTSVRFSDAVHHLARAAPVKAG